ncbi:MAG: YjbQ family protein [Hungatella hathewayi]|nr:YjbQ family protein [Hungatella hathewayi]
MREKVLLCRPGMGEITDTVMAAIVRSGIREGVCVVTALDDKAAVVMTNREKADIRQDIMDDLDRMVPARVNRRGWMAKEMDERGGTEAGVCTEAVAGEVTGVAADVETEEKATAVIKAALSAAARTKAAVTGGSLDVIIHEGMPLLAPDQGIFAVDYRGGEEVELAILCG